SLGQSWFRVVPGLRLFLLGIGAAGGGPSLVEPLDRSQTNEMLHGQSLVLLGTIFTILRVTNILMAFGVCKPTEH
uniref:Uncharacterized protein n=1 Tax=Marmota marmota marmota TaxID=9994 RepID=A0A8C5YLQ8_MARMA